MTHAEIGRRVAAPSTTSSTGQHVASTTEKGQQQ